MKINYLNITAFSVSFSWDFPLKESIPETFRVSIVCGDEEIIREVKGRNAVTLSGLLPGSDYTGRVEGAGKSWSISFSTKPGDPVSPLLFGARGDGIYDDTQAFQAAISCLPRDGILLVPEGIYRLKPVYLKSNMTIVLQRGAVLLGEEDMSLYPILPSGAGQSAIGTWEGTDNPCYASLITAVNCHNIVIAGEGIIDGNASRNNWWKNPKMTEPAARPRLVFFSHCQNISLAGVTIQNSPSWTVHPFCSNDLYFSDLKIINPADSPNTDGLNPEFCKNVKIDSIHFSVGDDCIAIKAGKKELADKVKTNTENILIRNCLMEKGHGAVVMGSEMSGGINKVKVEDCVFIDTDRGIRLKTRRGRGGEVRDISCESVYMKNVGSAFVFNMFYFCDADGKSDAVQNKNPQEINEGTPSLSGVYLKNIEIDSLRHCLLFMYGLPERYVEQVELENVAVTLAENAEPDYAAMMCDIDTLSGFGCFLRNVRGLKITGTDTEKWQNDIQDVEDFKN